MFSETRIWPAVLAVVLLVGLSACGSGSAKKPKPMPDRNLVLIDAKTGAVDKGFPDANGEFGVVSAIGTGVEVGI